MRRSILNRFIAWLGAHLLLSLLWLVGCLPLVTAPGATAALFEVHRQRRLGDDPRQASAFLASFRRYAVPALPLGAGWLALGAFLALDLMIVSAMTGPGRAALQVALLALVVVYALVSVALFPVLVWREPGPGMIAGLRAAAVVAMIRPLPGLLGLTVVVAAGVAVATVPLTALIVPSLAAAALLRVYQRTLTGIGTTVQPTTTAHQTTVYALPLPKEFSR